MFTDQKQYLCYVQICSDLICVLLLFLIAVPLIITVVDGNCTALFRTETAGICVHKTLAYISGALVIILIFSLIAAIVTRITPYPVPSLRSAFISVTVQMLPTLVLLWCLISRFPLAGRQIAIVVITSGIVLLASLVLSRIHIMALMRYGTTHHYLIKQVVLAGISPKSVAMARYILEHPESGLRFCGFLFCPGNDRNTPLPAPGIIGDMIDLPELVKVHVIHTVTVPDPSAVKKGFHSLFNTCATMGIELACHTELSPSPVRFYRAFDSLNGIPLAFYRFVTIKPFSAFFKRIFDFTGALGLILFCLPFWLVVPVLIKTGSEGPVFFRQERVGKYGRKFILYKFRSMQVHAEKMQGDLMHLNEMDGPAFKIKNDPRLTPIGRALRKYSLDELPQLFNVVRGDISLVGPRPAINEEVFQYRPQERRRLSVTQGITCIWQVSGRNELKFDEWMKLDLMYIDHWSSVSDFKILFNTVPAVLMKRGAY